MKLILVATGEKFAISELEAEAIRLLTGSAGSFFTLKQYKKLPQAGRLAAVRNCKEKLTSWEFPLWFLLPQRRKLQQLQQFLQQARTRIRADLHRFP